MCDTVMNECMQMRANVTCESVLFTPLVGCSRLLSAVNDLTTTNSKKKLVKMPL